MVSFIRNTFADEAKLNFMCPILLKQKRVKIMHRIARRAFGKDEMVGGVL